MASFRELGIVTNGQKGANDDKSLEGFSFRIGDYIDVAIMGGRGGGGGGSRGGGYERRPSGHGRGGRDRRSGEHDDRR